MKHLNLILFLFPLLLNAQTFVDRDANGSNDGSSWTNAYTDLQAAIKNAAVGAEVWVAGGIYFPSPNGDIDSSFTLTQSIDLYGGFSGIETNVSERDFSSNPTILSGDYNSDDDIVVSTDPLNILYNNYGDNAKRIVSAANVTGSIIIDGFTIKGGHAPSTGAGLLFTPEVELTVHIKNCILKDNLSLGTAGALRIGAGNDKVLNFRLENSSAINNSCTGGNARGGAIWATGSGTTNADFDNVLFHQNLSNNRGGAISQDVTIYPKFENCIFSENQAQNGGAIIQTVNTYSSFRNCTFYKNLATANGSVIWNFSSTGTENTKLQNCIFYDNGTEPLKVVGDFGFDISHSDIEYATWDDFTTQGNANSNDLGGNQYNVDPQFVDETMLDFNLSPNSPMVNTGNNTGIQASYDHTGHISRIVDGTVDLGALEYHLPLTAEVVATLCSGEDFGTAEVTANNYPPFTFLWSDPTVQGATPNNLTEGNYDVMLTNEIGDYTILSSTLVENPEITFNFNVTDPTAGNSDGTAMVNISSGTSPFTFEWDTDPVQTTSNVSSLVDGTYTVTITDADGCTISASIDVGEPSAVQAADESNEIEIGPNPFTENVRIIRSGSLLEPSALTQVLIYDATGRLAYNGSISSGSNTSIDLSQLSSGLYFMELAGKDLRLRKRLIKQ